MVRMPGNAHEVEEFKRFWNGVPGVDQVRVKEDETNLVQPEGRRSGGPGAATPSVHSPVRGATVRQTGRPRVSRAAKATIWMASLLAICGSNRSRNFQFQ